MISVEKILTWDESFFERLISFRNEIHREIPTSFPEILKDYSRFFAPGSVFESEYLWCAFLLTKDQKVVAKAILCWKPQSSSANLGFIDWINDKDVAHKLIAEVEKTAQSAGIFHIKTPVDLNFFVKYRIRCEGGGDPFYGEPNYPSYYHELFKATGFDVIGKWDTYKIKKLEAVVEFFKRRLKLSKRKDGGHSKNKNEQLRTTVRCVRVHKWDDEMKIIHDLFNEAYQNMPEFESINFEQFKLIYDDFKYIINPLYSYIVELRGKPVGFSINFVDPLPILSKYKNKTLNSFQKAILLLRLQLNTKTLLIAHVGKIPGPDGEEIKGIQIQVSKKLTRISFMMSRILMTFQNVDSPSRKSFSAELQIPYTKYVLYGKNLK